MGGDEGDEVGSGGEALEVEPQAGALRGGRQRLAVMICTYSAIGISVRAYFTLFPLVSYVP